MRPVPEILVKVLSLIALMLLGVGPAAAQAPAPYGIALEGYAYPYPVQYLALEVQHHAVRLAYMDVVPAGPGNCATRVLFLCPEFPPPFSAPPPPTLSPAA